MLTVTPPYLVVSDKIEDPGGGEGEGDEGEKPKPIVECQYHSVYVYVLVPGRSVGVYYVTNSSTCCGRFVYPNKLIQYNIVSARLPCPRDAGDEVGGDEGGEGDDEGDDDEEEEEECVHHGVHLGAYDQQHDLKGGGGGGG